MMKKRTVRIISCVIAGILVVAMLVSMLASSLTFAAAAEDADSLRDKLSTLEDEKAAVKERIAELTREANDVQATRDALQSEIDLTKEEITTVEAYIDRLQEQIDVKTSELEVAEDALSEKEAQFAKSVRTTYELGDTSYLEVLLNSSSFSDMLTRIEMITDVMDYNKKVVAEYTAAKEDIEQKRDDLQNTQDSQKEYQKNLSYKVDELAASEAEQAALQESLEAIRAADMILLGPGSLYTSIIPNLLVDGIVKAIRESDALKVYVCNVMTQEGETEGYTVSDHIAAIFAHSAQGLFRLCLTNSSPIPKAVAARYAEEGAERIRCDKSACAALGVEVVERPVATVESGFVRHSSAALARELILLHAERSVRIAGARFRPREDAYQMEERK